MKVKGCQFHVYLMNFLQTGRLTV